MTSTAAEPLAAAHAMPGAAEDEAVSNVIYLPRPMSHDPRVIAQGRMTAGHRYAEAKTNAARMAALMWVNHWRQRQERLTALRKLGLAD